MTLVRSARIAALCMVLGVAAAAQQPQTAPPPDDQQKDTRLVQGDQVVSKHSIFFPDLAVDRRPMTVKQKFELFANNSAAPSTFVATAISAGVDQATNTPSGYGQGAEGYGKRFGASFATHTSTELFRTFLIPAVAHQDPRYFVHGQGTFGQRVGHALSRVVVAPNDAGGYGFNWGGVFGPLAGETIANSYLPAREQTGARTASRYAVDLSVKAGTNIVREFWPDIFKRLGRHK